MADATPIPDDLVQLLGELQGVRNDPSRLVTSQFARTLYEMCHRQLGERDPLRREFDSLDLTQEVFLDLAEAAALFRGRTWSEFFGFVRTVIERRKVRQARQRSTQRRGGDRERLDLRSAADEADPRGTPSAIQQSEEERARLRARIQRLPEPERHALERYLAKVPYEAIAAELGVSPAAARKRVSRAIRRLKEGLT